MWPPVTWRLCRYFLRGQNSKAAATDFLISHRRKAKLSAFDKLLKEFR
jgi:U3 small nucleolar RNA-associated protein 15